MAVTVKEYLRQALMLKRNIDRVREQIEELRDVAERSISSYEAVKVKETRQRSKIEKAIIRIANLENSLAEMISEYAVKYGEIVKAIEALEDPIHRELLSLRYLRGLPWNEVAVKMGYSFKHVHKIHKISLKKIKVDTP